MGAAVTKCFGAVANDPKKMAMVVDKSFGMFDKDKSGFIEAGEAKACATQVLTMAGLQSKVKPEMIDSAFAKVAGADQKLDKAEFTALINQVLSKAGAATVASPAAAPAAAPAAVPADAAAAPATAQ